MYPAVSGTGETALKRAKQDLFFCLRHHAAQPVPEHHAPQRVDAHGHKPFVHLVAQLHFGRAVKHIKVNVVQFVRKGDGLFSQTAVRSIASCLRCAVGVVAHAFLLLGCFSVFSLWFRTMSDSVYQFVNATFHNGIGIAQHSVKHSFHGSQYNLVLYKSEVLQR